jgi:salicylate hydroxylase
LATLNHSALVVALLNEKPMGFIVATRELKMLVLLSDLIVTEYNPSSVNPGIVDRVKLRNTLMQGIEDRIQWNKRFVNYEEFPDRVVAHFEHGTTAEADLLIGADGARSKVRAQHCPQLEYRNVHVS